MSMLQTAYSSNMCSAVESPPGSPLSTDGRKADAGGRACFTKDSHPKWGQDHVAGDHALTVRRLTHALRVAAQLFGVRELLCAGRVFVIVGVSIGSRHPWSRARVKAVDVDAFGIVLEV
jgi:hypothetical protein